MNKALKREKDFIGQGDLGRCIRRGCHVGTTDSDARSLSSLV